MRFLIIALAILASACSNRYSEEEAIFIVHNRTNDRATALVDGRQIVELAPNSATNGEIKVLVAHSRTRDYGYGPSQIDKRVEVVVAFKNLRTGGLSREAFCVAGARVKTTIIYEPQFGTDGYAMCRTLDTYGNAVEPSGSGSQ